MNTTPYRIAYFGHHGTTLLFIQAHEELCRRGVVDATPAFLVFNAYWKRKVKKTFPNASIVVLPTILEWRRLTREGQSSDADAERAWKLDKMLRKKALKDVLPLWIETRRRIARFLDESRPKVMFSEVVQSLPCYAAYLECEKRKIPYVQMSASRLPGRMDLFIGRSDLPYLLDIDHKPSEQSLALAREFISNVKSKNQSGPDYMKVLRRRVVHLKKSDFTKGWLYLQEQFLGGILEPTSPGFFHPFVSKIKAYFISKQHRSSAGFKTFRDVQALSGKKLLFPLHVTPEASTDWWAPDYADMAQVVQSAAKSLPEGWTLIVKEHPTSIFLHRSTSELSKIRAVPRTMLVGPHESNDDLMEECEALLVINSTMGLEAAIKGYPVITLGKPFYDLSGNTIPCENYQSLSHALELAVSYTPKPDKLLAFLACYFEVMPEGYPVNFFLFPHANTPENIGKVATALAERFLRN